MAAMTRIWQLSNFATGDETIAKGSSIKTEWNTGSPCAMCNVHANTAPFSQGCPLAGERHSLHDCLLKCHLNQLISGAAPDQIFLFHNICDICESLLTVGSHIGSKYWIKQIPPRSLARSNVIVANITDSYKKCLQYSFWEKTRLRKPRKTFKLTSKYVTRKYY